MPVCVGKLGQSLCPAHVRAHGFNRFFACTFPVQCALCRAYTILTAANARQVLRLARQCVCLLPKHSGRPFVSVRRQV